MTAIKSEPMVSIVMPVYNAGEYIEKSLRSILNQSYRNIELIAVNDGSKDDTREKMEAIAAEDKRLSVISVENGGPAKARNIGLGHICRDTDFIMFADSDDELLKDAVEYAVKGAESGADMVVFGFSIVDAQGGVRDYCENEQCLGQSDFSENFARIYKANLLNQVWGKLYRASLIEENEIRFPDYRWGEDRLFIFDCLEKVNKLCILPECKYRYIMHSGESLITKYYDKKFRVCCEIDERIEALCESFGVKEQADFRYMFAKSVFSCLTNLYSASCKLNGEEKRAIAGEIISDERVLRRCRDAGGGFPTAVLCGIMRSGWTGLNLLTFRTVAFVGEKAPALFIKLKHKK